MLSVMVSRASKKTEELGESGAFLFVTTTLSWLLLQQQQQQEKGLFILIPDVE
jgi:hypothetical protein